jgi:hypothetical protein
LPAGEWVELVLAIELSTDANGRVRLRQDTTLLIDENARTLAESRSVVVSKLMKKRAAEAGLPYQTLISSCQAT